MARGKHSIKHDAVKKTLTIKVEGFLVTEGAPIFIQDYEANKAKLKKEETVIIVDTKQLLPFQPDFIAPMGELYKDYAEFKRKIIIMPENITTKLQVNRILRNVNLQSEFELVEDLAQVNNL